MTLERKKLGSSGEDLAEDLLRDKGYEILTRNLRLRYGEIDIVAQDGDYIVLIEVKTKTHFEQGRPEEKVDYFKKKKLRLLARALVKEYPNQNIRIDVMAVDFSLPKAKINHIINAVEE